MQVRINYNGVTLGKIIPGDRVHSKNNDGKSWRKTDIVLKWTEESNGNNADKDQYRKIEAFGRSAESLDAFKEGDIVDVQVKAEGRPYRKSPQDEWMYFNKDSLESITRADQGAQEDAPQESYSNNDNSNYDSSSEIPF